MKMSTASTSLTRVVSFFCAKENPVAKSKNKENKQKESSFFSIGFTFIKDVYAFAANIST
ncbi:hypothetical protein NY599_09385 [Enterobacter hormaechei]|nr:hypothetical protein [Enterobacter hormaechei]